MEMSKKNKNMAIWTAIVVLVLGLGYWYVARPYMTTTNCHQIALDNSGYSKDMWRSWAGNSKNQTDYMFVYEMCMHKEGINP